MKKFIWSVLAIGLVVVLITSIFPQQSEYIWSLLIRNRLVVQPEATMDVNGIATIDSLVTFSDSVVFTNDLIVSGDQILIVGVDTLNVTGTFTSGTGFWEGAPSIASNDLTKAYFYTEDFMGVALDSANTGSTADGQIGTNAHLAGWKWAGDAGAVFAQSAISLGGIIAITPATGSNNETYHQLGELGTEVFIEYTDSSYLRSWTEFYFATDAVTDAGIIFVGLAGEGSAAADFLNDSGADIADKDVYGFCVFEANPDTLEFIYQTTGSGFGRDTLRALTAGQYYRCGLYFDGDTTLAVWVDDTLRVSHSVLATGSPNEEELSPIIAVKNGAADKTVNVDWIKMVVERQ